jgi:hypothetical protein
MAVSRRTGQRNVVELPSADTLSKGELCQYDEAGEVISAVTAKGVLGIATQAATNADTVLVDILGPTDEVEVTGITGTMANSEKGNEADIVSGGLTVTLTESNGDFLITGWDGVTTSKCYGVFKNLAHGSAGAGVETT